VTCLAFAMQLAKKAVGIDKCPHISPASKSSLEAASQPPIKLVRIGAGKRQFSVGNETVLFRHEEKFFNPCGIGIILDDTLSSEEISSRVRKINALVFERVGQTLSVDAVAVRQVKGGDAFVAAVEAAASATDLGLVLMSGDPAVLAKVLPKISAGRPLLFPGPGADLAQILPLAKAHGVPLVVSGNTLEDVAARTSECAAAVPELMIDTGRRSVPQKLWDLTQARRLALKKSNRALGYPMITVADQGDAFDQVLEAQTYVAKYAGMVLLATQDPAALLALLTCRQNIYTDPQKPLQIEPKVYPIGQVSAKSPVLVTTNFSLSYYTVLGEVEASKVPTYILTVDTEGQSVLTAWASEKFNGETVRKAMDRFGVADLVSHKEIIIPGYVAVMSGDLEDQTGWKVIVGPKEAAGIPSFLKNR
jgi:acetyl-CoA decarbonylase/synthase, CODH/ACS complex subunit gamma